MPDNRFNNGKQTGEDPQVNESNEVSYLMSRFPSKTREQIMQAIKMKGPVRRDIMRYLERKRPGSREI